MNNAEQILVIVLASALAIFLILSIVIATQVIRLMKLLQAITLKAQDFVNSAEAAAEMVKSAAGKVTLLRFVHSVMDTVSQHVSKKDDK